MKFLIIGCGNIGQRHLDALLKIYNSQIYIVEDNNETLKKIKKKYKNKNLKYFFSNIELLNDQVKFDIILIATNSDKKLHLLIINNFYML